MWPFTAKAPSPPVIVIQGNQRAFYSSSWNEWNFEFQEINFILPGATFPTVAFKWPREALDVVSKLEVEISEAVIANLEDYGVNLEARHLFSIQFSDFPTTGGLDLSFAGDDSWADLGVDVIIANGKIVGSYHGDYPESSKPR